MRHQMAHRKLGRTAGHRAALFRNQLASMIQNERIVTTLPKAKELRPIVERMVTLGKNDSVHARRMAARMIPENDALVSKLFEQVSPRFAERPGGYTRIIKLGHRRGDDAEMAILEFVDYELKKEEPEEAKGKKKAAAAPATAPQREEEEPEEAEAEEAEAKPRKRQAKAKEERGKKAAARGKKKPAEKPKGKTTKKK